MKYTPYSYSKIDCYYQCPKKFNYKYVLKIKGKPLFYLHIEKGQLIHSVLEHIIGKKMNEFTLRNCKMDFTEEVRSKILKDILIFSKTNLFKGIIDKNGEKKTEIEFFMDENFHLLEKKKGSMITGKIDLSIIDEDRAFIIDWKTGGKSVEMLERYPKDVDQLKIYAICIFEMYPNIQNIEVSFCYVDHDYLQTYEFCREDFQLLKDHIWGKVETIEKDNTFVIKESALCPYCDFINLCKSERGIIDDNTNLHIMDKKTY